MGKRMAVLLGMLAVTLVGVTAAQSRPGAEATINIGWVGDKSGPTVGAQVPVLHAMEAYFRMVNDAGGVNGRKINLIQKDDVYNVAKELEHVKSVINDDKVVLVTGIGNSSGFASIVPVLNAAKVPGLTNQGTLKTVTWPFEPYMFLGNCNYADQADVALAYMMVKEKLKDLKGVKVGVAGIEVASGQEWIEVLKEKITKLGGTAVTQTLPSAIINADVQIQAFQDAKVRFILMHHAVSGGIAVLKSMSKYGLLVPISGSFGVTQDIVYTSAPYDAAKGFVGVNCYTPPLIAKTAKGKLAVETGQKYGYSEAEIRQQNWALGWVNAQIIHEALKNAKGNFTPAGVKAGLEKITNLDTGGLGPNVTLSPKCHMAVQQARPYYYAYARKTLLPVGTYAQWRKYITNAYAAPGTCGKPRGG